MTTLTLASHNTRLMSFKTKGRYVIPIKYCLISCTSGIPPLLLKHTHGYNFRLRAALHRATLTIKIWRLLGYFPQRPLCPKLMQCQGHFKYSTPIHSVSERADKNAATKTHVKVNLYHQVNFSSIQLHSLYMMQHAFLSSAMTCHKHYVTKVSVYLHICIHM